jgi:hypothetical protein
MRAMAVSFERAPARYDCSLFHPTPQGKSDYDGLVPWCGFKKDEVLRETSKKALQLVHWLISYKPPGTSGGTC